MTVRTPQFAGVPAERLRRLRPEDLTWVREKLMASLQDPGLDRASRDAIRLDMARVIDEQARRSAEIARISG